MGSNKTLIIVLGIAVLALVGTFMSGGFKLSEGGDPAQDFSRTQGGQVTSTPDPSTPSSTPQSTPPEGVTPTAGAQAAEAEAPVEETEAEEPNGTTEVAEDPGLGEDDPGVDGELPEEIVAKGEAPSEMPAPPEGTGVEADSDIAVATDSEDLFEEDPMAEEELRDPVERFKEMDPRDIIDAKYDDLRGRTTTPWNEEDPDWYIPETGRSDPLTRVPAAFPNELKPPREGSTDESLILTYMASEFATALVERISSELQCYNVLQIGLVKTASFTLPGQRFSLRVDQGFRRGATSPEGVNVVILIMVTSIATDQVVVNFSASAEEVSLSISKTQYYIPSRAV